MDAVEVSRQPVEQSPPAPPPGQGHHTALHRAAALGNSDTVAALIQGGCALDLQDKEGNTALHEVSWHGFSSCVKLLVKAGADVNIGNKAGNTALHLASQNDHTDAARLLLLGGSTPRSRNTVKLSLSFQAGDSCLHVAARYNNHSVMKILLRSVCALADTNQAGDTPLHVAAALNHKRAVQLLLEAGIDATARNHAGKTALDKARDHNHQQVALLLARAPQVHRFLRGRTRRKRRERLTEGCRSQSVTRLEIQAKKDSSSLVEETPSNDPMDRHTLDHQVLRQQLQQLHQHTVGQSQSPNRRRRRAIQQAPPARCHCRPLLHKLQDQLKVTQDQFVCNMLKVQEQVDEKMSRMDRRSRHQMKVLDLLNQERVLAERRKMIYTVEQRLAQGQEETLVTQAAVNEQLKRWCVSMLKDVRIQNQGQNYRLLPSSSSSVDKSGLEGEPESLPLLPLVSGGSSMSLATYVNVVPADPGGLSSGQEPLSCRSYFEMREDRSSDDYENTAVFSLHDNLWLPGSSSSSSFASGACGQQGDPRKLESFRDPLPRATFIQERNNLHAKEVTQRFFDAVSAQLERWYERKVAEVELEVEVRGRRDREELQQQVEELEEELRRLKMSGNAET